jgi:UDP-N-acetylmuramyl tripeptide synthase
LGKLAGQYADYVIVTNEDPYDEDPQAIINEVADGALHVARGRVEKILDREEAIQKALSAAGKGDIVIITGKGSETVMAVAGSRKIPWDDRAVVRELLRQLR